MPPTPRPDGPKKKATVKVPSSGRRLEPPPADHDRRRRRPRRRRRGLGYVLFGGGGSSARRATRRKQLEAAGCTVQTVKSLPSNDHSVLTPGGHVGEVEHFAADERAALPDAGDLGLVHRAAAAGAGRAQPRARRHLHPVRQGRPAGDGRPAEDASTTSTRTARCSRRCPSLGSKIALGAWTTKSATTPDDGTAYLAKCTDVRRGGVRGLLRGQPVQGPGAVPDDSLAARLVAAPQRRRSLRRRGCA